MDVDVAVAVARPTDRQAPWSGGRRSRDRARAEPWRDWAAILLLNHALLMTAALTDPALPWLLLISLALALGLAMAALTVLHDAGHQRFARSYWPNMLAVQTAAPVGLWVAFWTLKHRLHHRLTAVFPTDEFTRSSGLVRLHPQAPRRPIHRLQHVYAWPLYGIVWLGELRSQLRYLTRGEITGARTPRGRARARSFVLEKAICLLVLLPYGLLMGAERLGILLVVAMTVAGFLVTVVLAVGHINVGLSPVSTPPSSAEWTTHLLRTTASFSIASVATRWVTGGMTLHLAHHLRPAASRGQLPEIHRIVVANLACGTDEVPVEFATFREAVRGHGRLLKRLGQPEPATVQHSDGPPVIAVPQPAAEVPRVGTREPALR